MMIIVINGTEIVNVADPFPMNNPQEGIQEDGNMVIYVNDLEGLSGHEFIRQRYWDGTSLQPRSAAPSPYCSWNGTAWEVNSAAYLWQVRYERDMLLYRCDWTQLPDAPLTSEQLIEATTYRQALRDMTDPIVANPSAYVQIEDAPWPTPPEWLNVS